MSMCNKCGEIDAKIARYRWLANSINDGPVIAHLLMFITELDSEKGALHQKPDK
jgi:hypothetical protein